ncbi:MAG: GntR family transcriptional regulator [Rhodoferax sp.]|jgi:GntR family transcriptional regulator|nr:GntR family transcriptional regulator [Rhodoferax sp.]
MPSTLPLPKYHQIYLVLREQLHEGHFAQGLPPEMALSKEFGAGRVTVRRALEQLAAEGLIVRQAGRGTHPAPSKATAKAADAGRGRAVKAKGMTGLLENIVSMSLRTSVKVLELRVVSASDAVADALQIAPGSKVQKAVRRRSSKLGPVSHITTYVPEELTRGFGRKDLLRMPILRLIEESGVEMGRAHQTVSARQADAAVAAELGVAVGTALLAVRRLVFDSQDRPVQWLHGLYRPDRYEYQMDISQVGSIDARISVKENLSE